MESGRSVSEQGGMQIVGWFISIGIGSFAAVIIGLLYRIVNGLTEPL